MKKKLKGYIFVDDEFGMIPIISLMHPTKESGKDAFLFGKECEEDIKLLRRVNNSTKGDLIVTADIVYKVIKTLRIITSIDIESIGVIRD